MKKLLPILLSLFLMSSLSCCAGPPIPPPASPPALIDLWKNDFRILYVKVVADEEYRELNSRYTAWQEIVRDIINRASEDLYLQTGIKLEIVEIEEWESQAEGTPEALNKELRKDVPIEENFDVVIGFSAAKMRRVTHHSGALDYDFPYARYLLVADWRSLTGEFIIYPKFTYWHQKHTLIHILGHLFGAVDLYERTYSIMSSVNWTETTQFDEKNLKIILENKYMDFKQNLVVNDRILYVKVVADEEYRELNSRYTAWQEIVRDIINRASEDLYLQTGIKLEIVEIEEWESQAEGTPEALNKELRKDVPIEENFDVVIGFSAATMPQATHGGALDYDFPYARYLLVADLRSRYSPWHQKYTLLHMLGHLFGAVDLYDRTYSIMSYSNWTKTTQFDEKNLKIILKNKYMNFKQNLVE